MKTIESENRTVQAVIEKLKPHVEGMGHLPDEYFLLGGDWGDGREFPQEDGRAAELLLDRRMDFKRYRLWAKERGEPVFSDKVDDLQEYLGRLHTGPGQTDASAKGGMSL